MSLLALLDLDHTLFKTEEFWEAVTTLLEHRFGEHGITAHQFRLERLDRNASGHGRSSGGEGYDFFAHVAKYDVSLSQAKQAIIEELGHGDWLNTGALDLIDTLRHQNYFVAIETTGADEFQMLKVECSGLPRDIPVHVIEGNKGTVNGAEWDAAGKFIHLGTRYGAVVFIDDSAATFDALGNRAGLTCIQILGSPKHPTVSPHDWVRRVSSLEQILPIIEELHTAR